MGQGSVGFSGGALSVGRPRKSVWADRELEDEPERSQFIQSRVSVVEPREIADVTLGKVKYPVLKQIRNSARQD